MAAAMRRGLEDPDLRRGLIANGLETVRTRFDNQRLVGTLAAGYRQHAGF
jgi:hypothetical protein